MRRLVFLSALLACLAGCAAPAIKQEMLMPAAAGEVTKLRRLAVAGFENDRDGQVRSAAETALASVVIRDKPYFTLVDARALRESLDRYGKGVEMDAALAKKLGKSAGADGIVTGSVTQNTWGDERYTESRSVCESYDPKGKCRKWGSRKITCTKRTARFSFTPRIVNVATGALVASQAFTETEESKACQDKGDPASGPSLVAAARERAVTAFRNHVAPHYVDVQIKLVTEDDSGMSPPVKAKVANGAEFAKQNRADRACELWREAAASHQAGYALPYLTGVCAEIDGDLDEAQAAYSLADKRASKPVPEIGEALSRIKTTKANISKLDRQIK